MRANVTFVGAGPGDINLITVKGLKCIQEADCILYDRLIDPQLLQYAKSDCECIYVGKKAKAHTLTQVKINDLLVVKAKQYSHVVRLKGGDVFVFGRGGEEALHLKEHNITFDIVPGISSCIAGLAYAGIPITHRGLSSGFHVMTAHNEHDALANMNFYTMLDDHQTYVFMMGLSMLHEIVQGLLSAGKQKDTKIAVIASATMPNQTCIVSDLQHIEEEITLHAIASPALIVVGEVVKLRKDLHVFEKQSLFHARICIPKIDKQILSLTQEVQSLGAWVKEVQVSTLHELPNAFDGIHWQDYNYLIFTSKNTIRFMMQYFKQHDLDIRLLANMKIAVIGSSCAAYLKRYHLYADVISPQAHSEGFFQLLSQTLTKSDRVLFPRVKQDSAFVQQLQNLCHLREIHAYENLKKENFEISESDLENYDFLVFNCSSSVHLMMDKFNNRSVFDTLHIISIGEMTSKTLTSYGLSFTQADEASYDAIKNKIVELWEGHSCIEAED